MRTLVLVSLTLAAAVAAGGCRPSSNDADQSAFQVPKRDLTLQQADAPPVEVASPVELARAVPPEAHGAPRQRAGRRPTPARHSASPAPRDTASRPATTDTPDAQAPSAIAPLPVRQAAYTPSDPYALAPGQTVTVLPASGGSPSEPGPTDAGPPDARHGDFGGTTIRGGGHGGRCGGRGHPGSGGAPGLRGLR
jgi:hypothetical protein